VHHWRGKPQYLAARDHMADGGHVLDETVKVPGAEMQVTSKLRKAPASYLDGAATVDVVVQEASAHHRHASWAGPGTLDGAK
jgi:hypothetical protein